jgi:uncharacterized membrane protein HdeD (DUF308 family)
MSTIASDRTADILKEEANSIRTNWGWFVAFGIVMILAGTLAVGFAFSSTLASVVTLGVLLLIAAGAQTAAAIWARSWGGFFLYLLLGVLYAVSGFLMIQHPLIAAESLTILLAAAFLVGGVYRMVVAVVERFPGWGWVLFNGVITLLLGVAIWQQWPASSFWLIGTFVGIDLIVNGATWAVLAVVVHKGLAQLTGN